MKRGAYINVTPTTKQVYYNNIIHILQYLFSYSTTYRRHGEICREHVSTAVIINLIKYNFCWPKSRSTQV